VEIKIVPDKDVPKTTAELLERIMDPFGVYCVLEVAVTPTDSLFHVFPVMPESLEVAQRYLHTITPTQGGVFIDDFGRAPSPIVLSGTFGRSPRVNIALGQDALLENYGKFLQLGGGGLISDLMGTTASGGALPVDEVRLQPRPDQPSQSYQFPTTGYRMMKMLGEMVELSHRVDKKTGYLPVCRFYNFAYGAYYEVALESFDASMTVNRNGLWNYRLQMTTIRRLNEDGSGLDSMQLTLPKDAKAVFDQLNADYQDRISRQQSRLDLAKLQSPIEIATLSKEQELENKVKRLQRVFDAVNKTVRTIDRINGFVTAPSALDLIGYGAAYLDRRLGLDGGTVGTFINNVRNIPRLAKAVENIVYQVTRRLPAEMRDLLISTRREAESIARQITPILQSIPALPPVTIQPVAPITFTYDRTPIPPVLGGNGSLAPTRNDPLNIDLATVEIMELALNVEDACDAMETLLYVYGAWDMPSQNTTAVLGSSESAAASIDEGSAANSRQYIIKQGDTLAKIAQWMYGDENSWPRIAQANRALFGDALAAGDAYNEIGPSDYLDLYIGRVITLPSDGALGGTLVPYVWDEPIGTKAMGADLPDTLQTVTRTDGTKDLLVLSPLETLLQGCLHRLRVPLGAIGDDPDFGSQLPGLIGQTFGALDDAMNAAKAEQALRAEGRLVAVNNVAVAHYQDRLGITFRATARNAGSLGAVNVSLSRQSP
jgi:phage baseplate assembly protein W